MSCLRLTGMMAERLASSLWCSEMATSGSISAQSRLDLGSISARSRLVQRDGELGQRLPAGALLVGVPVNESREREPSNGSRESAL